MTDEPQSTPPPNPGEVPPPNPGQVPPQYGQVPPGYPPPPQYGQVPPGQYPPPGQYGYQPVYIAPKHPQATLAMVLGIVGLTGIMCYLPFVVAPFAWWIGHKSVKEIDADPVRFGGRGEAMAGKIMGIVGTVFLTLGLLFVAFLIIATFTIDDFWDDGSYDDYSILGAF